MKRRRAILGVQALCLMALCAFAAQGASGATKGTTAFTCTRTVAVTDFKTEHCVPGETGTGFGHTVIPESVSVTVSNEQTAEATSATTPIKLKSEIAEKTSIEVVATGVSGSGSVHNELQKSGEHSIRAEFKKLKYTGVTEKLLGCKVTGEPGGAGTIETQPLTVTTVGQGDAGKLSPEEGTLLAEFKLTECAIGPLVVKVFGTISCKTSGATISCSHGEITAAKTLRLQNAVTGPVAGIEAKTIVRDVSSQALISPTTVETPRPPTKGTTGFTCSSSASVKDFKTEHCVPGETGTGFGHVAIPEEQKTEITVSNEKTDALTAEATPVKLKATLAGTPIELVATGAAGTGIMENRKAESGEHYLYAETTTKYTGVTEKSLGCEHWAGDWNRSQDNSQRSSQQRRGLHPSRGNNS